MTYNDIWYDINKEIINNANKNNYKVIYGWKEPNKDYYIDFDWLSENNINAYKNKYDNTIIYGIECLIDIDLDKYIIDYTKQEILFNAYQKVYDFYDYYNINKTNLTFYNSDTKIDNNYIESNNIYHYYPIEIEIDHQFDNTFDEEY